MSMKFLFTLAFLFVATVHSASSQELKLNAGGQFLSYFGSQDLNSSNELITHAIIVVHGSDCNAGTYFNTISSITSAQNKKDSTLVIAPHFKTPSKGGAVLPGEFLWKDEAWLQGDLPITALGPSSFDLIDLMINSLLNTKNFPNLKAITLTGHSAGGQLTQRFAVSSQIENQHPNIHFQYIVLNPGSYVYLNEYRPDAKNISGFSVPTPPTCSYKYGLNNLNEYFSRISKSSLIDQFLKRDVTYLLGQSDTNTDPEEVDQSCPAALQGGYRYERGLNFKSFLDHFYPTHHHRLVSVPNIGHTESGMYRSPMALNLLF